MSMRTRMWLTLVALASMVLPGNFLINAAHAAEPTVIVHSDFENGTTQGWGPRGGGVVVAATTEASYAGTHSLKTTGRTQTWQGPSLDVTAKLHKGVTYAIEGYVKLVAGQPANTLVMTMQREAGGTNWDRVAASATNGVTDAGWVKLAGEYSFSTDVSALQLYIESSDATSQYYVDALTITQMSSGPGGPVATGVSSDFENGTPQGWGPRGSGVAVAVSTEGSHTGTSSLKTTGRTQTWQGPSLNIINNMTKGEKYSVSVWAKLAPGEADTPLRVSIQRDYQGVQNYDTVVGNTVVTANQWVNLKAEYTTEQHCGCALDLRRNCFGPGVVLH